MNISLIFAGKSLIDLILPALTAFMALLLIFLLARGKSRDVSSRSRRVAPRNERTPPPTPPLPVTRESYRSPAGSVPCFLLLGPPNSGKTALLNGLHQAFSGWGRRSVADLASGVARWHFASAEVIEIAGSLFAPAGSTQDQHKEKEWKSFLSHLQRRRPQRPLEGIVLALPSTHLVGSHALSSGDLQHHATQAACQLKLLRDQLGFCLPIYVVVTKCDAIPGYKPFVKAQLAPHLNEIFGWSNPYNLDAPFDPQWTAQAFTAVFRTLSAQRVEFFSRLGVAATDAGFTSRSELFLFPVHLQELQAPLAGYLEHLFQDGGHRDGLQFRGIYFSGSAARTGNGSAALRHDQETGESSDVHGAAFTADLFEQKIFPEHSLARPVETAFAQRRIELTLSRWLCTAAALLLFPGALWGWYRLSQATKRILPRLSEIRAALHQSQDHPDAASAYAAIYAAQSLSGRNLQSAFLPASMIDSIDQQVQQVMPPVFNRLVYPGLHAELERRTRDLVRTPEHPQVSGLTPELAAGTNASQRLSYFTDALLTLETNILRYNGLAPVHQGLGKDTLALAASFSPRTFADLPSHNTSGLDDIVRASSGVPFDGQPWNKPTAARLESLVTGVLRESTNEEQLITSLDTLIGRINLLEENKLDTYEQLNGLLQSVTQVGTHVAAPDMQWVARSEDQFQLPDELNQTLNRIFSRPAQENILLCDAAHHESPCVNLQLLQASIEEMARAHYVDLRKVLLAAQTKTTGPLIATTNSKLQLSQPTIDLQTVLDRFLKLSFVAHEGAGSLRDVEAGQQLFWDNERLQAAIQDKQAYDKFFESELANTSDNLQDTFEEVALSRLEANMVDSVASAQQFQSLPSGDQAEQATTNEVRNFQAASQSLNQVLEQFSELGFDDDYQDLLRVSAGHAFMVLSRVDRAFDSRKFYWPAPGNFDSWSTNSPPSSAYGTHNSEEMAAYLVAQRQDVQRYVASAQPLAAFLQQHNLKNQRQTPVIAKWQSIVSDLQKYESAPPASGLGSVEEFLSIGMDAMVPPDCQTPAPPVASNLVYFVQVRRSLERALGGRCHFLSNQSAFRQYNQVADFFNQHLAGKFPFSASSEDPSAAEADPADLVELFHRLDVDGKSIRQGLQTPSGVSPASIARITIFLNQIDALRPPFASLASGQPGAVPAFDLAPAFRVNRNHEINGNQIIDWSLQVGGNTFRNLDPPSTSRWTFGEPVKLMLRWAKDSPQQPVPVAPATANAGTRTVIFEYRDSWSLLKALAQHAPPSADLDRSVDSDPQTLVFIAGQESAGTAMNGQPPTASAKDAGPNQTAKVFVRIRIYAPGKTDALRLPPFPTQAPAP